MAMRIMPELSRSMAMISIASVLVCVMMTNATMPR